MQILKLAPWAVVMGLAACATGSGRLPAHVVELYDVGAPNGWMEIEAERNGRILEAEVDIDPARLPDAVLDAAKRELPGALVTGAEIEYVGRQKSYEVKLRKGGRNYEFVFTPEGEMVESEKELRRHEAPAVVLDAALESLPGGSFKSVEIVSTRGVETYHVKLNRGGASYKIVLAPDGTVQRRVREAKAEIEIPLAE